MAQEQGFEGSPTSSASLSDEVFKLPKPRSGLTIRPDSPLETRPRDESFEGRLKFFAVS
jgi:hypothetical protein